MSERDLTSAGANTYRVLARKYRPKDFTDLMVGQEPMVRTLTNAFASGRIAQAYMLTGVRGVGKTTTARILARALNYKTDTVDRPTIDLRVPGEHCQAIIEGRHVDVVEMDAASHTGIDDIRDIIEQIRYRPVSARFKVYIIDEVHMLSTAAFNGLLKTLEEPPEHVKFIFATTEIRKVPITVLSRCQRFDLRRISAADLVQLFTTIMAKEDIEAEPEALAMIARAAEGSARDGLSLLDQAISHGAGRVEAETVRTMLGLADRSRVVDLFEAIASGKAAEALTEFGRQYESGANPAVVLTDLAEFTHLVTRLKYVPGSAEDASLSEAERVRGADFATRIAVSALSRFWQILLKGISETEASARPFATAEMVLIRLCHAASLPSPEDAARRLAELMANGGTVSPAAPGSPPRNNGPQASGAMMGGAATAVATAQGQPATQSQPQPGPRMAQVPHLRAIEGGASAQPASLGRTDALTSPDPARPDVKVSTLQDIVDLCSEHRDAKLKALVRNFVRPVSIEPGRLSMALADNAPPTLSSELGAKLKAWTGIHWIISISREAGAPTQVEAEAQEREDRLTDARADPDVAAILTRFPGARIIDVRIRASENGSDDRDAPLPAAIETADGDILPGDDLEF